MLERLPTPWGLVRSGVAPDHPKIKSVTRVYEKTAAHPRFRYFGNVTFGEHVSREDLLAHYHAIVYATGSPSDRPLGIPGEELPGSHAATEFVGWYNGHPDHTDLEFDLLSAERAVVIGNGNVALDVARMLVLAPRRARAHRHRRPRARRARPQPRPRGRRRRPPRARAGRVHEPRAARARRARRRRRDRRPGRARARARRRRPARRAGHHLPAQRRDPARLRLAAAPRGTTSASCCASCSRPPPSWPTSTAVSAPSSWSATSSSPTPGGRPARAAPPTSARRSPPGLAFRAIGYRGIPLPGVPFDERSAVIPNAGGRVLDPASGAPLPGEYVVGWIKRGPSGVIGTNKKDAQETVDAMLADLAPPSDDAARAPRVAHAAAAERGPRTSPASPTPPRSRRCCARASPSSSPTPAGRRSTATSARSARPPGRPRVKLTRIEELLQVAAAEGP